MSNINHLKKFIGKKTTCEVDSCPGIITVVEVASFDTEERYPLLIFKCDTCKKLFSGRESDTQKFTWIEEKK